MPENNNNRPDRQNPRSPQGPEPRRGLTPAAKLIINALIIVGLILLLLYLAGQPSSDKRIDSGTFWTNLENHEYSYVFVDGTTIKVWKQDSNLKKTYDYYTTHTSYQETEKNLKEYKESAEAIANNADFDYNVKPPTESLLSTLLPYIFIIGGSLLVVWILMRSFNKSNNSALSFGRSRARVIAQTKITFADVAGCEEEKQELKEIVDFLRDPEKFIALGARIPKGFLLVGPPGTGKTLLAKAVAGESSVPFYSITGSDFVEMFVGVGASRVRDLFEQAKHTTPCIIFIDEIDAVGRQRGTGLGGGNDEREQTLNQLLVQMDGFESNSGIIVIAATNRSDVLDPALLRPGRFDRQIYVYPPDVRGREQILAVHAKDKPLSDNINMKTLARLTTGFTGADIEMLLNESAILAARANRAVITMTDLTEAINKVIIGPQKKSRLVTENDKKITAYHEAGHAIVGKVLMKDDKVAEVSIIPRGMAAGYTLNRPDTDDNHVTISKLKADIAMTMGGRAAEALTVKDITTGASSDIQNVRSIAHRMVCEWGMSRLGPVNYGSQRDLFLGRDFQARTTYSDKIAADIDAEVKQIIEDGFNQATKVLKENMQILENMAELLLVRETIYGEEIDMLMAGDSVKKILEFLKKRDEEHAEKAKKEKEESDKRRAADLKNKKERATLEAVEFLQKAGIITTDVSKTAAETKKAKPADVESSEKKQEKPKDKEETTEKTEAINKSANKEDK